MQLHSLLGRFSWQLWVLPFNLRCLPVSSHSWYSFAMAPVYGA
jgi:hypothetical protein